MFVPVWLIFLSSGLIMAVGALVWAVKSNQFEDQQRARYLPLVGLSSEELADLPPIRKGVNFYAILGLMALGIFSIAMTLWVMARTL